MTLLPICYILIQVKVLLSQGPLRNVLQGCTAVADGVLSLNLAAPFELRREYLVFGLRSVPLLHHSTMVACENGCLFKSHVCLRFLLGLRILRRFVDATPPIAPLHEGFLIDQQFVPALLIEHVFDYFL
jgi:hypothetical protein